MKMPKITFRYSWPYDRHWDSWIKQNSNLSKRKLLEEADIFDVVKQLEKLWNPFENKILKEISTILKLDWQEKGIICYIVSNGRGISDPMTIGINRRRPEKIIHTLIYELTHRIFTQDKNKKKAGTAWNCIRRKYESESRITQIHVVCHSLLKHLYLKFFDEKSLREDIQKCQKNEEYRKAWEIVECDDYRKIIEKFVSKY